MMEAYFDDGPFSVDLVGAVSSSELATDHGNVKDHPRCFARDLSFNKCMI